MDKGIVSCYTVSTIDGSESGRQDALVKLDPRIPRGAEQPCLLIRGVHLRYLLLAQTVRDELQVLQSSVVGGTTAAAVRLAEQGGEERTEPARKTVCVGFVTGRRQRTSMSSHIHVVLHFSLT